MFYDAKSVPSGTLIEADICIIGAGAAGITLACALEKQNVRVALFESGGLEFDPETQALYTGESAGQEFAPLDVDRLRYFGGSTNHWSGGCNPFHGSDFRDWPFSKSELNPYYEIAQRVCQLGKPTYDAKDWETPQCRPIDFGSSARFRTGIYQFSPPTRFGQVYRAELENSKQISVYLNANLIELESRPGAGSVTGLRFARLDRQEFRAHGRYYVLATGAIENARLLLTSTGASPNGLGNENDLVGRYFMDHAYVRDFATIVLNQDTSSHPFYKPHDVLGQSVAGYFYLDPEVAEKEGFAPFSICLEPIGLPDRELARSSLLAIYQNLKMGQLPPDFSAHVGRIYEMLKWKVQSWSHILNGSEQLATLYCGGVSPDSNSRITLSDQVDALGMRRVKLDWQLPSDFVEKMHRAHEILASELGRVGQGRLRINSPDDGRGHKILNAHHHMGTTRMHRDPRQGVLDEHCRVHSVDNLFVAGSSVYPSYSFDDPTMTIVALTLRLADRLKSLVV